ncbi:Gamma-tubulin complex component 2 [Thelohanellus kitauei]|uniref:Gamma-tubulin complex component n=1 Tax=Thelohanellus kitauei TaxID=669202 RepID=A0A0C2JJ95_THEKT|nr:Gamma-tubulin complex component 2 [Thelohanellus kitauei]
MEIFLQFLSILQRVFCCANVLVVLKLNIEIDISKLDSLLELAIRNSVLAGDPFSENVGIVLLEDDFATHQLQILGSRSNISDTHESDGIRSLTFTMSMEWPLSLIIDKFSITKYQMIFRHLFYIKYCSFTLSRLWQNVFKTHARCSDPNSRNTYCLIITVINKMLHFLNNFEYFIQCDVINPNWNILMYQIANAESFNDLISRHNDFLDKTLKDCMLTHAKLVEGFSSIINLCYTFSNVFDEFLGAHDTLEFRQCVKRYHDLLVENVSSFIFLVYGKGGDHFEHNMITLVERLDFNNFYSETRLNSASPVQSSTTLDS